MSQSPTVSLVIVSRKRPFSLRRTISSLRFQSFEGFEVIVVSDAPDGAFLSDLPFAENICYIPFDEPNISVARNIGVAAAHGEIVAFCDDDAVPDPQWLERLIAPFQEDNVSSAGGYVRGRNGIELQWTALSCDALGEDQPVMIDETRPYEIVPFAKLQGTNCAFRKDVLDSIGGFDVVFRFFLDETDVCFRLAQARYASAFVPLAQVHHGFAASDQRSAARVPKSLFDLGASKQRYLDKHADPAEHDGARARFASDQRTRLIGLMNDGRIEPRDVTRLMATLVDGFSAEPVVEPHLPNAPNRAFKPFGNTAHTQYKVFGGSTFSRRKVSDAAQKEASSNIPVFVMIFSITSLFHRRDYDVRGYWVQRGGIFGKSHRQDAIFRAQGLRNRIISEFERIKPIFPGTELRIVKIFRNFVLEKTKSDST